MKFSTRARYGLRVLFMIGLSKEHSVSLSTLVKQTSLSEKYLEQLLGKLKKSGIIGTARGVNGGYFLAKEKENITINEILKALDDSFELTDCTGGAGCDDNYCPNKRFFKKLYDGINGILDNYTLDDMINEYRCVK